MLDFIKNILGITSSDEPKPNNQNLEEPEHASKYVANTTHEEREFDEETFKDKFTHTEETHDLIFKLIDEIKDLKIVINNTNKKVKELLAIIDKKVLKNDD